MSKKALKVFFFCVFTISYINIGNIYESKMQETHREISSAYGSVDINFENGIVAGPSLWMAGDNEKEIVFTSWFRFILWPVLVLINIAAWIVWFLIAGGILEGPYTIPLVAALLVSGYFFFRK
jgi:hypothetical protein